MDRIMEENIKSFAKGFVDNQSRIAEIEDENRKLKEENRKLKEESYNELQRLGLENYELREENKKLKSELDFYKKQYEHTMGED